MNRFIGNLFHFSRITDDYFVCCFYVVTSYGFDLLKATGSPNSHNYVLRFILLPCRFLFAVNVHRVFFL